MPSERTEPLIHSRHCPGGPAVFVNTQAHIAQCPGGCDIWFDTMMDEPVFPPHTVTFTTTITFDAELDRCPNCDRRTVAPDNDNGGRVCRHCGWHSFDE